MRICAFFCLNKWCQRWPLRIFSQKVLPDRGLEDTVERNFFFCKSTIPVELIILTLLTFFKQIAATDALAENKAIKN